MIVRMWEVRAQPRTASPTCSPGCATPRCPSSRCDPLHVSSEVFSSTDHRVVVISKWRSNPRPLPEPPAQLVARAPHVWDFTPVDR